MANLAGDKIRSYLILSYLAGGQHLATSHVRTSGNSGNATTRRTEQRRARFTIAAREQRAQEQEPANFLRRSAGVEVNSAPPTEAMTADPSSGGWGR